MKSNSFLSLSSISVIFLIALFSVIFQCTRLNFPPIDKGAIIISGASTGIGRHAAEHLARQFPLFKVFAGVRKSEDELSIQNVGLSNLIPLYLDVLSEESCKTAIDMVKKNMSLDNIPLVALVNSAGTLQQSPLEYHNLSKAHDLFDLNFFGMVTLTQIALPLLRESKGRVVQISSVLGEISMPRLGMFSASKAAVESFSDALRRELLPLGVSVSIVEPGFIRTVRLLEAFAKPAHSANRKVKSELRSVYSTLFRSLHIYASTYYYNVASEPTATSEAIADAITSPYPKTRYRVAKFGKPFGGLPVTLLSWIDWTFPDRIRDKVVLDFLA